MYNCVTFRLKSIESKYMIIKKIKIKCGQKEIIVLENIRNYREKNKKKKVIKLLLMSGHVVFFFFFSFVVAL